MLYNQKIAKHINGLHCLQLKPKFLYSLKYLEWTIFKRFVMNYYRTDDTLGDG